MLRRALDRTVKVYECRAAEESFEQFNYSCKLYFSDKNLRQAYTRHQRSSFNFCLGLLMFAISGPVWYAMAAADEFDDAAPLLSIVSRVFMAVYILSLILFLTIPMIARLNAEHKVLSILRTIVPVAGSLAVSLMLLARSIVVRSDCPEVHSWNIYRCISGVPAASLPVASVLIVAALPSFVQITLCPAPALTAFICLINFSAVWLAAGSTGTLQTVRDVCAAVLCTGAWVVPIYLVELNSLKMYRWICIQKFAAGNLVHTFEDEENKFLSPADLIDPTRDSTLDDESSIEPKPFTVPLPGQSPDMFSTIPESPAPDPMELLPMAAIHSHLARSGLHVSPENSSPLGSQDAAPEYTVSSQQSRELDTSLRQEILQLNETMSTLLEESKSCTKNLNSGDFSRYMAVAELLKSLAGGEEVDAAVDATVGVDLPHPEPA